MLLALGTAILILFVFLRTLRGVIIPLITAISSVLWTFGAMGYLDIHVDTQVMTLPVFLGMAVSIGYSIHIFTFFEHSSTPQDNDGTRCCTRSRRPGGRSFLPQLPRSAPCSHFILFP